jgi:undecaprenyl diphosphate synthase
VFLDTLWPDFTRTDLWEAVVTYARRSRRFGGAVDAPTPAQQVEQAEQAEQAEQS